MFYHPTNIYLAFEPVTKKHARYRHCESDSKKIYRFEVNCFGIIERTGAIKRLNVINQALLWRRLARGLEIDSFVSTLLQFRKSFFICNFFFIYTTKKSKESEKEFQFCPT